MAAFRLLLLVTLISLSMAVIKNTQTFSGTDDLFDTILTGDHKIYVIFFFNSEAMHAQEGDQELHEHVIQEKQDLSDSLEQFDDNVNFIEIDTAKGDYTEAMQAFSL